MVKNHLKQIAIPKSWPLERKGRNWVTMLKIIPGAMAANSQGVVGREAGYDGLVDFNVNGKTGSTERPYHAWFECFAEDSLGRTLIVAVLVEGGQRGAGEAALPAEPVQQSGDDSELCAGLQAG